MWPWAGISRGGRAPCAWALIGSLAIGAVCAAAPAPYLHYGGPAHYPLSTRWDPFQLRKHLYPVLKNAGIRRIELQAGPDSVVQERSPTGSMVLDGLPSQALHAVLLVLSGEYAGAEFDILFEGAGTEADPDRIWTVRRDLEGGILIVKGGPPLALDGPDPRPEELSARFGIGPLLDAKDARWSARERRLLERALELLSPRELALVAGVSFAREKVHPRGLVGRHAQGKRGAPSSVVIADRAFTPENGAQYVGSPEQAVPNAVFVILHEIGHVVAFEERRRLRLRRDELSERHTGRSARTAALREEYRRGRVRAAAADGSAELAQRLQQLQEELERSQAELLAEAEQLEALRVEVARGGGLTSVEKIYGALPGALAGPTAYGRGNASEGFAEAFALYHLDPETLRWLAPDVHDWFAASAHLETAEAALADVAAPARADASPSSEPAAER